MPETGGFRRIRGSTGRLSRVPAALCIGNAANFRSGTVAFVRIFSQKAAGKRKKRRQWFGVRFYCKETTECFQEQSVAFFFLSLLLREDKCGKKHNQSIEGGDSVLSLSLFLSSLFFLSLRSPMSAFGTAFGAAAPVPTHNPNKDFEVTSPPSDGVSSLAFSPVANLLVAGSWDNQVRCWDVQPNGTSLPKAATQHDQPVLCTAWSADGTTVFSGEEDGSGLRWIDFDVGFW